MRIAFVTDIHIGATAQGFQMQPRWIEGTPALLSGLARRLETLAPDLTIVGGDMVELGIPQQINQAADFLRAIPGPTLLCLGNHDLTDADSASIWRQTLSKDERITLADAAIELPGCDVIGLNTHWLNSSDTAALCWTPGQCPRAAAPKAQLELLEKWLARHPDRPAILAMHSQLNGVPVAICGGDKPFEPPTPSFESAMRAILARHPRVRATLSAARVPCGPAPHRRAHGCQATHRAGRRVGTSRNPCRGVREAPLCDGTA